MTGGVAARPVLQAQRLPAHEQLLGILRRFSTVAAATVLALIVIAGIGVRYIAPHDPELDRLAISKMPPAWETGGDSTYLLGTDTLGRDMLSRIIWGARVTLMVGAMAVLLSGTVGGLLGLLAGFSRGLVGKVIMSITDIQMSIPPLILALGLIAVLGPGLANVVIVVALTGWTQYCRIVRSEVLSLRERDYVVMARVCGSGQARTIFRHILPNVLHTIVVIGTLEVGRVIVFESSLSFLGLGIQPPAASWGSMLADGRNYLSSAWWVTVFPGLAIVLTVLSINVLGDWLRDALDPHRT